MKVPCTIQKSLFGIFEKNSTSTHIFGRQILRHKKNRDRPKDMIEEEYFIAVIRVFTECLQYYYMVVRAH